MLKKLSCLVLALMMLLPAAACGDTVFLGITPAEPVRIHTELQEEYLQGKPSAAAKFADGTAELSWPEDVTLVWNDLAGVTGLLLSTKEDFSDAVTYPASGESVTMTNLKLDTTYYWKVTGDFGESGVSAFRTQSGKVRNLRVDGVTNVRDLGGYPTVDGRVIRQGLLFRSGRLNQDDAAEVVPEITEDGIRTMTEELGIRTEIDLRWAEDGETGGLTGSVLGEGVNYINIPMLYSFEKEDSVAFNADAIRTLFAVLADESNYPILFHCSVGTDRTGMIGYLVNGLCGVEKDDLTRDYMFSDFGNIGWARNAASLTRAVYVVNINKCEGETLAEKIRNRLLGIGIPEEQLDAVVGILCE